MQGRRGGAATRVPAPRQGVEQVQRPHALVALLLRPEPARRGGRGEQRRLGAEGPFWARVDDGGPDRVVPVQRLEPAAAAGAADNSNEQTIQTSISKAAPTTATFMMRQAAGRPVRGSHGLD